MVTKKKSVPVIFEPHCMLEMEKEFRTYICVTIIYLTRGVILDVGRCMGVGNTDETI